MESSQLIVFATNNKISLFSLENRMDYHLERVMKSNRLVNFKNSIQKLSVEKRIVERILEILSTSENMMERQVPVLAESHLICQYLMWKERGDGSSSSQLSPQILYQTFCSLFPRIKELCHRLGQVIWALKSNREHVRYVCQVFVFPDVYVRDQTEHIRIKEKITKILMESEQVIAMSKSLRENFQQICIELCIKSINV